MAEGIIKNIFPSVHCESAGSNPADKVNPLAIDILKEIDIDISQNRPKSIDKFINEEWDYLISVCANADDNCPVFIGNVKNRIRYYFDDPSDAIGNDEAKREAFRNTRDLMIQKFNVLFMSLIG
jgi:arsenate reductase